MRAGRGKTLHHLATIDKNDSNRDLLHSILAITASSTTSTSESNTLAASATSAFNYIPDAATIDRLHEFFININKEDVIWALEQCDGDQDAAAELMLQMSEEIQQQLDIELSLKMNSFSTSSNHAVNEKENLDISLNSDFDDVSSLDSIEAHDYTLDDVLKCAEAESTNTTPMKDYTNTNMDDTSSDIVGAFSDFCDFSIDSSSLLSPNELQQCLTSGPAPPVHAASTPPSSNEIIATSSSMITDSDNDGTSSNDDHESVTAMLRMFDNNVLLHHQISKTILPQ